MKFRQKQFRQTWLNNARGWDVGMRLEGQDTSSENMAIAMKIKRTIFILILAFVFFQLGSYADQGGSGNIIIYGDTRTNSFIHQKIVNRIMENNPSVVFHVGDL